MMRMRLLLRAAFVLVLLTGALLHAGPAAQSMRVIVVVNDPAVDPDYTAVGATVEERWSEHRVVRIDGAALARLAGDPAVRYVQHIEGEPAFTIDTEKPAAKLGDPAVTATPPTWFSGEYRYDAAGNIKAIGASAALYADGKQTLNGDSKSNAYYYDSVGRLLQAEVNNATNAAESYRYDSFGNLIERTRTASSQSATNTTSVSTATNRIDSANYDAAGNLTSWTVTGETYDYDAANMVISKRASSTSAAETYLYTAGDERIATRRTDSTWHWTVRDFDGKVLREYESASDSPSATWAWIEDYVYRGGFVFAAARPLAQGGIRHFHLDHLGTPRLITDSSGRAIAVHDYFPYGSEQTTFNQEMTNRGYDRPEPMAFTGQERDYTEGTTRPSENYVDYMHARDYRAAWGRFLSVDPVLNTKRTLSHPQTWNRYAYVENNPVNMRDPDGRNAEVTCQTTRDAQGQSTTNCTATVVAQIVVHNQAERTAAQQFANDAASYWNQQTVSGKHGENITFNVQINVVTPNQQVAGRDTLTAVSGAGRSQVNMTLDIGGNSLRPDTGSIYTQDTTANPSGMAGIAAHETGHLMGLRDLYPPSGVAAFVDGPQHSIMEMAQPHNNADYAWWVLNPNNGNTTVTYVP